jgi:Neurotransmitter-gated ion-channel ligand binding domain/Neurotransmitter-gated ion-channel transmembrane region
LLLACSIPQRASAQATPIQDDGILSPPPSDGKPVVVSVAMHVVNLTDIDEVAERFNLMFYLFAEWTDTRLAFTPRDASEKFRMLEPSRTWHPRVIFANEVSPRTPIDISLRVKPDGKVQYAERSSAQLSSTFHLRSFPFDQQKLEMIIHPYIGQIHLVTFSTDQGFTWISAEEKLYSSLAQWDVMDIRGRAGQASIARYDRIPEVRFEILVKRKFHFYIWKVFVPLLLMVALSWTVYWIDPKDLNSQVQISITTILTVIAFAFSISLSLPKVPYLTFIDAFFLNCLIFVFFTAIEMTTVHVSSRTRRQSVGVQIRKVSRVAVPIAFVITNAVLVLNYFG